MRERMGESVQSRWRSQLANLTAVWVLEGERIQMILNIMMPSQPFGEM